MAYLDHGERKAEAEPGDAFAQGLGEAAAAALGLATALGVLWVLIRGLAL